MCLYCQQKSAAFMKNAKRRRLCPEDFNQALRGSDVQVGGKLVNNVLLTVTC